MDEWPVAREEFLQAVHNMIIRQGESISDEDSEGLKIDTMEESAQEKVPSHPRQRHSIRAVPVTHNTVHTQWKFVERYFCENWFTD